MSGLRVAVLASGTGTNLQAVLEAVHGREGIEVVAVAGDEPAAPALERARSAEIEVGVFEQDAFADRAARDGSAEQADNSSIALQYPGCASEVRLQELHCCPLDVDSTRF